MGNDSPFLQPKGIPILVLVKQRCLLPFFAVYLCFVHLSGVLGSPSCCWFCKGLFLSVVFCFQLLATCLAHSRVLQLLVESKKSFSLHMSAMYATISLYWPLWQFYFGTYTAWAKLASIEQWRKLFAHPSAWSLVLQETKLSSINDYSVRSTYGIMFDQWESIDSINSSGGILTFWKSTEVNGFLFFKGTYSLGSLHSFTISSKNSQWLLTNVYGPVDHSLWSKFLSELKNARDLCQGPWILVDDFNLTRLTWERNRARNTRGRYLQRTQRFYSLLQPCLYQA